MKEIERAVEIFYHDLLDAFHSIQEYRRLYMSSDLNLKIMLGAAPNFFANYQRLFWHNILLIISRMLDPREQFGKENLSIEVLAEYAAAMKMPCVGELKTAFELIRQKSKKITKLWRPKILAHKDLETALRTDKNDLKVHIDEVEAILLDIGNCLQKSYGDHREVSISWSIPSNGTAEALLLNLKEGLIYSNLKANRNNWQLDEEELKLYGPHLGGHGRE